jgi:hypothetical protein
MISTCSIRPSTTTGQIAMSGSVPIQPTMPAWPLTSVTSVRNPGMASPAAAIATTNRETLSAPAIGRRAAFTLPPPSLTSRTSGANVSSRAATSPPAQAAKNRSVTWRCVRASVSNRGRRA